MKVHLWTRIFILERVFHGSCFILYAISNILQKLEFIRKPIVTIKITNSLLNMQNRTNSYFAWKMNNWSTYQRECDKTNGKSQGFSYQILSTHPSIALPLTIIIIIIQSGKSKNEFPFSPLPFFIANSIYVSKIIYFNILQQIYKDFGFLSKDPFRPGQAPCKIGHI